MAPIDNVELTNISYSRNLVQNKLVISEFVKVVFFDTYDL